MPWKLTYFVNVDWVGAGQGGNQRVGPTLQFEKSGTNNTTVVQTMLAADVTTLTNALAADINAQMVVPAKLAQIAGWANATTT